MWGLKVDDLESAAAFITGCAVTAPEVFSSLNHWSIARIRGTRDKYGWPGALKALAAQRVAEGPPPPDQHSPLVSAYLALVCDYLREMEDEAAPQRLESRYNDARSEYHRAHDADAHSGEYTVLDAGWHDECWRWQQQFAPALTYLPRDDGQVDST